MLHADESQVPELADNDQHSSREGVHVGPVSWSGKVFLNRWARTLDEFNTQLVDEEKRDGASQHVLVDHLFKACMVIVPVNEHSREEPSVAEEEDGPRHQDFPENLREVFIPELIE